MDINAGNHGEEKIPFPDMDAHIVQMAIIQFPLGKHSEYIKNKDVYPQSTGRNT